MAPNHRSSGAIDAATVSEPFVEESRPSKKRKKVQIPRFTCTSCGVLRLAKSFPDVNPSAECEHLINTCSGCLKKWVKTRVGDSLFEHGSDGKTFGVRCPECPAVMREVNVEDAATKKVFRKFQELARCYVAETVVGWRWCMNVNCKAGQVHDSNQPKANSKRSTKPAQDPDICVCNECGSKACVACDRPDHRPETCVAYQARVKGRTLEDDLSRAMLQKISKPCPSCSNPIQKAGGCDSMLCLSCHANFCWQCLEVYSNAGCACTGHLIDQRADVLPPVRR